MWFHGHLEQAPISCSISLSAIFLQIKNWNYKVLNTHCFAVWGLGGMWQRALKHQVRQLGLDHYALSGCIAFLSTEELEFLNWSVDITKFVGGVTFLVSALIQPPSTLWPCMRDHETSWLLRLGDCMWGEPCSSLPFIFSQQLTLNKIWHFFAIPRFWWKVLVSALRSLLSDFPIPL